MYQSLPPKVNTKGYEIFHKVSQFSLQYAFSTDHRESTGISGYFYVQSSIFLEPTAIAPAGHLETEAGQSGRGVIACVKPVQVGPNYLWILYLQIWCNVSPPDLC